MEMNPPGHSRTEALHTATLSLYIYIYIYIYRSGCMLVGKTNNTVHPGYASY